MGRMSTKENKTEYQLTREALDLSRDEASDLLETITSDRLEKIENERSRPHPDEVLTMAKKYNKPSLCNYYCSQECPIGKEYVPKVSMKDLSVIVIEMLHSLNCAHKNKDRLIEIAVDGAVSDSEIADFIEIQNELERISVTVETLQLWAEQMLVNGKIDQKRYHEMKNR